MSLSDSRKQPRVRRPGGRPRRDPQQAIERVAWYIADLWRETGEIPTQEVVAKAMGKTDRWVRANWPLSSHEQVEAGWHPARGGEHSHTAVYWENVALLPHPHFDEAGQELPGALVVLMPNEMLDDVDGSRVQALADDGTGHRAIARATGIEVTRVRRLRGSR